MNGQALRSVTWHQIRVSGKTCWIFVQLQQADGCVGYGEASLAGKETDVIAAARHLSTRVLQATSDDPGVFADAIVAATLAEAAVVSAVDQALWDLHGRQNERCVADMLGGRRRDSISVYANINRRTEPRSPQGFAQSARDALAAGHVAFKLAPFDEVNVAVCAAGDGVAAMQAGLERIAAVRDVVGPGRRLMVDCHWRFDESTATALVHTSAEFGLHWIECPLPEIDTNIDALVRLRRLANSHGIRLAGLEQGVRFEAFRPYCEAGAYDVVMPDVKYFGGLRQMLDSAAQFARHGVMFSPHNPTGPICHAASLQIAAAATSFDMLEVQFDESPLFDHLVKDGFGPVVNGHCQLPAGAGLGVALENTVLQAHAQHDAMAFPGTA